MKNRINRDFLEASLVRAFRTGIQTILSFMTIGQAIMDVNWQQAISVTLTATLISFLNALLTGLPEMEADGKFIVDDTNEDTTKWTLKYDGDPNEIQPGDRLSFIVEDLEETEDECIPDSNEE